MAALAIAATSAIVTSAPPVLPTRINETTATSSLGIAERPPLQQHIRRGASAPRQDREENSEADDRARATADEAAALLKRLT